MASKTTGYYWNIKLAHAPDRLPFLASFIEKKYLGAFDALVDQSVHIISPKTILKFIDEELIHDNTEIFKQSGQTLNSMSSGERKRAFLTYILNKKPEVLILDHFFDNLDTQSKQKYYELFEQKKDQLQLINIYSRGNDRLPFLEIDYIYENDQLTVNNFPQKKPIKKTILENDHPLPPPIHPVEVTQNVLVEFNKVNIAYLDKNILRDIDWKIEKGQFWHLYGPNGSGKTTLLTMITGDNPKAYGQNMELFGKRKGSGESIWEIKQKVGYFTTNMTFQFKRLQSAREMIISGFFDSIGLYQKASDHQIELANAWAAYIGLSHLADHPFVKLSMCHQRMVMIARAMVKHPPLLILDEPSVDLDDSNALVMTSLINRIANEGTTTIIYVSHRMETGLCPTHSFELIPSDEGSIGITTTF